jgi:AcrR family transcriptional regulator
MRHPSGFARVDAERNRSRLILAARQILGADASASMTAVAKQAGVGPATLRRHFPTRAALLEEVYRHQIHRMCRQGHRAAESRAGGDALAVWLGVLARQAAAAPGLAREILAAAGAEPTNAGLSANGGPVNTGLAAARAEVVEITETLLAAARQCRAVRPDVTALDLLALVTAVAEAAPTDAVRLLGIVEDGWRTDGRGPS